MGKYQSTKLFDNYTHCCEELCEVCNNEQVFETEDGYMADCPRCN